ncbi:hypothetical protein P7K49_035176 [Saguinus oedipus]|uniref:Uncharacterized protein n=1 Tax=Saguinus oedipus TaxID=9490 RepID=A0ABQ9TWU5_SAGOE|nr:hypothetical protein P7K49_035176 [Saguinus oedipus]
MLRAFPCGLTVSGRDFRHLPRGRHFENLRVAGRFRDAVRLAEWLASEDPRLRPRGRTIVVPGFRDLGVPRGLVRSANCDGGGRGVGPGAVLNEERLPESLQRRSQCPGQRGAASMTGQRGGAA